MCRLLQFLKNILCHYDASLSLALPPCLFSDNFPEASYWSVWTNWETPSEIKFCSSALVERKRQWCHVSFTASSRVCLCGLCWDLCWDLWVSWIVPRLWVELQLLVALQLLVHTGSAFHSPLLPFVAVRQMQACLCQDKERHLQLEPLLNAAVLTQEIL